MNNHLNPIFRDILNAAAPRAAECAECKILLSVAANSGHARGCSKHVELPPVPYNANGFYHAPRIAQVAAIGNGIFVRVGGGRKRRAA